MKTIQIAPHATDCKVSRKAITGTMAGLRYTYTLPLGGLEFELADSANLISGFQQAIAFASHGWQAERALNEALNVDGGKFTIERMED